MFNKKFKVLFRVIIDEQVVHLFNYDCSAVPTLGHEYIIDNGMFCKITRIVDLTLDFQQKAFKALISNNVSKASVKYDFVIDLTKISEVKFNGELYYEYK